MAEGSPFREHPQLRELYTWPVDVLITMLRKRHKVVFRWIHMLQYISASAKSLIIRHQRAVGEFMLPG